MRDIQYISTGEVKVGQGDIVLQSTPIGSCIVIMAWHRESRLGGMAHIMLPGSAPKTEPLPTKYALNAIEKLCDLMDVHQSLISIGVYVVGGANVLKKPNDTICLANIQSVMSLLSKLEIPIRRSVLGGFERRTASLDTQNGLMQCTQGNSSCKILWNSDDMVSSSPIPVFL